MPYKIDTSYTVEFDRVWQHPMGPIFNIGDKAGVSQAQAEDIEQRGVGRVIYNPEAVKAAKQDHKEEVHKDVKSPAKNKQVRSSKTK